MKLIEKLANQWAKDELKKRPSQPFEDYHKTVCAYEAGFRKALEMALELEDRFAGQFQLRKHLENLGEEETE